jgi:hypothetical protein
MEDQTVYNITIGSEARPGKLTVLNGSIDLQLADGTYLIKDGVLQGLQGTRSVFVAITSGGSPTKNLIFKNGLLVGEA